MPDETKQLLRKYTEYLETKKNQLSKEIIENFRSMMLRNRYTVHPRRINELGEEEVSGLIKFLQDGSDQEVIERGKSRASEGLGKDSFLFLGRFFRQIPFQYLEELSRDEMSTIISAVDEYISLYITGFIEERENYILREQERLRRAYAAAARNQDSKKR